MATTLPSLVEIDPSELDIVLWPDEALSAICDPVEEHEFGTQLEAIGKRMLELIYMPNSQGHAPRGIGLAAPQVGITKRFFVMTPRFPKRDAIICVNPIVTPYGERNAHQEGCLSTPDMESQVIRPYRAHVKYQDAFGNWHDTDFHDYDSFCAQHENDHLDGIMFFDTRRMDKNLSKRLLKEYNRKMGL